MPGEMMAPIQMPQGQGRPDELGYQQLELKNALPLNIYICMEYASVIESGAVFGNTLQPRVVKGFYASFWHIYHYVKNSIEVEKLDPDLIQVIDKWFEIMPGQSRNTEVIRMGVGFFLEFAKNMQEWGIGRLFEKGIDPPFASGLDDDFDFLSEEPDEEVISGVE